MTRKLSTAHAQRGIAQLSIMIIVAAGALFLSTSTASAAPSKAFAIGLYGQGEQRVLSAKGTSDGSAVGVASYVVDGGASVNMQRWKFDFISTQPFNPPRHIYRIVNAQTGLCLGRIGTGGPQVQLRSCTASGAALTWYTQLPAYGGGFWLRNNANTQCLNGLHSSGNAQIDVCYDLPTGGMPGEHWVLRTGPFQCAKGETTLCVRSEQPIFGLMDTWQQHQINYSGTTYSNMLNFLRWGTLDSQGADSQPDGFEFGWESRYSSSPREENAYWVEQNIGSYEYHNLSSVPGGSGANGRLHTYMVVPGEDSQHTLYFDFIPVANTTKAESTKIGESSGGLFAETVEAATFPAPFEHRMQLFDGNNVWRRPWVAEVSTHEVYPCDAPRNAPATGGPNAAPRCLNASMVSKTGTSPLAVDYFAISKPSPATLGTSTLTGPHIVANEIYNGVDQRALANCMASDPSRCIHEVPGLAECVKAHKACNMTTQHSLEQRKTGRPTVSKKQALKLARQAMVVSGDTPFVATKARVMSTTEYTRAADAPALRESKGNVVVISGNEAVRSLLGRVVEGYSGYTLAFSESTGALLHACLGTACPIIS